MVLGGGPCCFAEVVGVDFPTGDVRGGGKTSCRDVLKGFGSIFQGVVEDDIYVSCRKSA